MSKRKSKKTKRKSGGSNNLPINFSFLWDYASLSERRKYSKRIKGKAEKSRTTFEKYILISSSLVEAMLNDDDVSFQQGINYLSEISLLNDAPWQCFMELGFLMLVRNMASLALSPLAKAIEMMPDERELWSLKSHAHLRLAQKDEAILCMESAVELAGHPQDIEMLKKLKNNAYETNKLLLAAFLHPGMEMDSSDPDLNSVDPIRMQIYMVKQIEKLDPNVQVVSSSLGNLYYCLNDFEEAEKYIRKALALKTESVSETEDGSLFTCLGLIAQKTNRIDDMVMYYSEAIASDSKEILARINLASFYNSSDKGGKARPLLLEAIRLIENSKESEIKEDLPCLAYDLFANNVVILESDLRQELQLRNNIITSGIFQTELSKSNYLTCLFFNGEFSEFLSYLEKLRGEKFSPKGQNTQFRLYEKIARTSHNKPLLLLEFIQDMVSGGMPILQLEFLARKAFVLTDKVKKEFQTDFLEELGMFCTHMNNASLEYEIYRKAHKLNPNNCGHLINYAFICSKQSEEGRKKEGYDLISQCQIEDGQRYHTMKGNLCWNLGKYEEAIENYKHAIEHDMEFDLPITNGMEVSIISGDWDSADFFSNIIQDKEIGAISTSAIFSDLPHSYAKYAWKKGCRRSAIKHYLRILSGEDGFRKILFDKMLVDLTMSGGVNLNRLYWEYGCLLLELMDFEALDKLFNFLDSDDASNLRDADITVLHAEFLRAKGNSEDCLEKLEKLEKLEGEFLQIPCVISKALVFLGRDDLDSVDMILKGVEQKCSDHNYNFWLGNSVPVLKTLQSKVLYHFDKKDEALQLAKEATSLFGATFYSDWEYHYQLQKYSPLNDCINEANNLLKLRPNNVQLISWLIDTYIENSNIEEAKNIFFETRVILEESGLEIEASKFSEQIVLKEIESPTNEIQRLILEGESKTLEFKETLSVDIKTNKKEKYIELSALKTIVAFLNTRGGTLLIGVRDDGLFVGVEEEINKFHKMSADKFLLHFSNIIKARIGEQFYPFIDYYLAETGGKNILRVDCLKSSKPCYLDNETFYVRTNPATGKLEGPKLVDYVQHHF